MPVATQSGVPAKFTAGDAVVFNISDPSHPASIWNLDFILSRAGQVLKTIRAAASINDYTVSLSSADSSVSPGRCQFAEVFTEIADPTQRESGCSGWLMIFPNPTGSLPLSDNQKALAACNQAIAKLASSPRTTVNFNGQSFTNQNISSLFAARDRLQVLVNSELAELGLTDDTGFRIIRNRFR